MSLGVLPHTIRHIEFRLFASSFSSLCKTRAPRCEAIPEAPTQFHLHTAITPIWSISWWMWVSVWVHMQRKHADNLCITRIAPHFVFGVSFTLKMLAVWVSQRIAHHNIMLKRDVRRCSSYVEKTTYHPAENHYRKCSTRSNKQTYAIEQSKDLSHIRFANSLCGGKTSQLYRKRAVNLCDLLRAIAHLHTVRHNHTFITFVSSFAVLQITNESDHIEQAYTAWRNLRQSTSVIHTKRYIYALHDVEVRRCMLILCEQLGVSV